MASTHVLVYHPFNRALQLVVKGSLRERNKTTDWGRYMYINGVPSTVNGEEFVKSVAKRDAVVKPSLIPEGYTRPVLALGRERGNDKMVVTNLNPAKFVEEFESPTVLPYARVFTEFLQDENFQDVSTKFGGTEPFKTKVVVMEYESKTDVKLALPTYWKWLGKVLFFHTPPPCEENGFTQQPTQVVSQGDLRSTFELEEDVHSIPFKVREQWIPRLINRGTSRECLTPNFVHRIRFGVCKDVNEVIIRFCRTNATQTTLTSEFSKDIMMTWIQQRLSQDAPHVSIDQPADMPAIQTLVHKAMVCRDFDVSKTKDIIVAVLKFESYGDAVDGLRILTADDPCVAGFAITAQLYFKQSVVVEPKLDEKQMWKSRKNRVRATIREMMNELVGAKVQAQALLQAQAMEIIEVRKHTIVAKERDVDEDDFEPNDHERKYERKQDEEDDSAEESIVEGRFNVQGGNGTGDEDDLALGLTSRERLVDEAYKEAARKGVGERVENEGHPVLADFIPAAQFAFATRRSSSVVQVKKKKSRTRKPRSYDNPGYDFGEKLTTSTSKVKSPYVNSDATL